MSAMSNNVCIRAMADLEQINSCKQEIIKIDRGVKQLSDTISLAGNEVRMKILYLLKKENELCVCDISDILNMKIPAISQHLRKLKDGGIVDIRKEGQTYYYYIIESKMLLLNSIFQFLVTN